MPASARRRVVRVLVDAGLIIALCAATERCCGILFAVGVVVLLIAVMTAMMAMTGATVGGLVTGVRLRRVMDPNGPPGRSAVIYVAFLTLSLVATAGLAPLVLWVLSLWRAEQRTWFDRLAGTVSGDLRRIFSPFFGGNRRGCPPCFVDPLTMAC